MRERMNQLLDSRPNRAEQWASACSRRDTCGDLHNQSHRVNCDALVASPTMRTLFLNASKTKHRPLRYAVLGVALLALLFGLREAVEGLLGRSVSAAAVLGFAVLVAVVALSVRWFHLRRLQSDSRNLKDSALW
jgi:hypothetical protein